MNSYTNKLKDWLSRYKIDAYKLLKNKSIDKQRGHKIKKALTELTNSYIGDEEGLIEIPSELFIACLIESSKLCYISNQYNEIDLQGYIDTIIDNTNEICKHNNDLYIVGNFGLPSSFLLKLTDCRFINNKLVIKSINELPLAQYISNIHGMKLYKGYIYICSRTLDNITTSKIVKINMNNFNDLTSYTLPNIVDYQGKTNDIIVYKNYIYLFISKGTGLLGSLIKLNLDLTNPTILFNTGLASSNERIRSSSTFLIYNNEIFIPTIKNTVQGYDKMGMQVYNMSGTLLRSVNSLTINAGGANATPLAHWMTIWKNKIIISNAVMGSTTFHRTLVRMDLTTLAIEESIALNTLITDDNSILSDDYIYLNGEYTPYSNTPPVSKLLKIKYNNFADFTELKNPYGTKGSYGSINPDLNDV